MDQLWSQILFTCSMRHRRQLCDVDFLEFSLVRRDAQTPQNYNNHDQRKPCHPRNTLFSDYSNWSSLCMSWCVNNMWETTRIDQTSLLWGGHNQRRRLLFVMVRLFHGKPKSSSVWVGGDICCKNAIFSKNDSETLKSHYFFVSFYFRVKFLEKWKWSVVGINETLVSLSLICKTIVFV